MEQALSNNHFSHEQQLTDVLNWLQANDPDMFKKFIAEFPEWSEAKGDMALILETFDDEWPMWATDWIETVTDITWDEGEPWLLGTWGGER